MAAVEYSYPEEMFEVGLLAYAMTRLAEQAETLHERAMDMLGRMAPEALGPGSGAGDEAMDAYWQPFYTELDRREAGGGGDA